MKWNTNVSPSHIIANIRRAQTVISTPLQVQQQASPLVPQQFVQQSHYVQHNSPILNQQIAQSRLMSPQQQQVHMIHQQQHQQKMSPQTVNSHNYQMNISPSVNYHQQPQQFNQHQQLLMQQQPQHQQPHLIHNQHNHH